MWKPEQHSDDENLRWALLRAIEWKHWPLFLSQPIVPVLLYFYPWTWVIGFVAVGTFAWWFLVAPETTPSPNVDLAVYFVYLRFVASPLMAFLIWQSGRPWIAVLALLWPFLGTALVGCATRPRKLLATLAVTTAMSLTVIAITAVDHFKESRLQHADSDDFARSFRDDLARCSNMMSPA